MNKSKALKIISLKKNVVIIKEPDNMSEIISTEEQEVIVAPFLIDEEDTIEDISELVDVVYEKFSQACGRLGLKWEAEIEMGLQFGVKFSAKLKISPKDIKTGV